MDVCLVLRNPADTGWTLLHVGGVDDENAHDLDLESPADGKRYKFIRVPGIRIPGVDDERLPIFVEASVKDRVKEAWGGA